MVWLGQVPDTPIAVPPTNPGVVVPVPPLVTGSGVVVNVKPGSEIALLNVGVPENAGFPLRVGLPVKVPVNDPPLERLTVLL
jgi:hypothetical protein